MATDNSTVIVGSIDITYAEASYLDSLYQAGDYKSAPCCTLRTKARAVLNKFAQDRALDRVCEIVDENGPAGSRWDREDAKAVLAALERAGIITIKDPAAT